MINRLHRAYVNWSLTRAAAQLAALREYSEELETSYASCGFSCDSAVAEILETREEVKGLEEEVDYLRGRLTELSQ